MMMCTLKIGNLKEGSRWTANLLFVLFFLTEKEKEMYFQRYL